jgi:hypothetical protein
VNFLFLVYAVTFLLKLKASNTRFSQLVTGEEISELLHQSISDCQQASTSSKHAAGTAHLVLRVLSASWRAREAGQGASVSGRTSVEPESSHSSGDAQGAANPAATSSAAASQIGGGGGGTSRARTRSGLQSAEGNATLGGLQPDALDAFLADNQLFGSALLSQGTPFLDWTSTTTTAETELQQVDSDVLLR